VLYLIIPTIALAGAAWSSYYVFFHAAELADIARQHEVHIPVLAMNVLTLGPAVCSLIIVGIALLSMIPYFIMKRIAAQFILGVILLLISICISLILLLSIKLPLEKIKESTTSHSFPARESLSAN
jgi:hypothetical protein